MSAPENSPTERDGGISCRPYLPRRNILHGDHDRSVSTTKKKKIVLIMHRIVFPGRIDAFRYFIII